MSSIISHLLSIVILLGAGLFFFSYQQSGLGFTEYTQQVIQSFKDGQPTAVVAQPYEAVDFADAGEFMKAVKEEATKAAQAVLPASVTVNLLGLPQEVTATATATTTAPSGMSSVLKKLAVVGVVLLVLGAIGVSLYLSYLYVPQFQSFVDTAFATVKDFVVKAYSKVAEWVQGAYHTVITYDYKGLGQDILRWVGSAWEEVKKWLGSAWEELKEFFVSLVSAAATPAPVTISAPASTSTTATASHA
jgi:hypothetical protein